MYPAGMLHNYSSVKKGRELLCDAREQLRVDYQRRIEWLTEEQAVQNDKHDRKRNKAIQETESRCNTATGIKCRTHTSRIIYHITARYYCLYKMHALTGISGHIILSGLMHKSRT